MPIAALPLALGAVGIGAGIAGAATSGGNKGATLTPVPPPQPVNPALTSLYNSLLTGTGTQPGIAQQGATTLSNMITTGMPTDVGPAFEAIKAASQRGFAEDKANMLESFGAGGLRYGSSAMQATVDLKSQEQAGLLQTLADYTRQAQEAAANRQLISSQFAMESLAGPATSYYNPYVATANSGAGGLSSGLSAAGSGLTGISQLLVLLKLLG